MNGGLFKKILFDLIEKTGKSKRMNARVGIIGLGNIGGALAHSLLIHHPFELCVYDINPSMAQGKTKDLIQGAVVAGVDFPRIQVVSQVKDMVCCDVIVITAGKPRQPGMDRKDLLRVNRSIVTPIAHDLKGTVAKIIVVTNPVDVVSLDVYHSLGAHDRRQVIGMSGALDSGRFRALIAQHCAVSAQNIDGYVIGPHNDDMIPVLSSLSMGGARLSLEEEVCEEIIHKTRTAGAEIVALLGQGSAFYAPAEAIRSMILSIVYDQKKSIPCSVKLEGEYGVDGLFCGVPVILGQAGAESILEYALSSQEKKAWDQGVARLRAQLMEITQ